MPTHEPELSEPYYEGHWVEGPYGSNTTFGVIQYLYTEDDGYSYDPDAPGEVEWLSDSVASGPEVNWSDDAEKRQVGEAILRHRFGRQPSSEELGLFMEYIAPSLEDGKLFALGVGQLDEAGLQAR